MVIHIYRVYRHKNFVFETILVLLSEWPYARTEYFTGRRY